MISPIASLNGCFMQITTPANATFKWNLSQIFPEFCQTENGIKFH